jgi:hypothetical protein
VHRQKRVSAGVAYPFTDELDRRYFREAAETAIRMQEAAGAQQIFLAGQPFAPWTSG